MQRIILTILISLLFISCAIENHQLQVKKSVREDIANSVDQLIEKAGGEESKLGSFINKHVKEAWEEADPNNEINVLKYGCKSGNKDSCKKLRYIKSDLKYGCKSGNKDSCKKLRYIKSDSNEDESRIEVLIEYLKDSFDYNE